MKLIEIVLQDPSALLLFLGRAIHDSDQVQEIDDEGMLDSAIHGRGRAQRWTYVNFHEPRLQICINEDIEAI